jgi:ATP-binding protein involved in chromosome partitioning
VDPRQAAVADRLAGVRRIVAVTGSKGGIGKSAVACLLALSLADRGAETGLFDLDLTSPSDHVVLGGETEFPRESFGLDPHRVLGIEMMSVAFLSGDAALPLRGQDVTNALLELLAVTRWGELDVLVLDMPPGLGDAALDVIRLLPRAEFLLVGTASRVVIASVGRATRLLAELGVPLLGVVENMARKHDPAVPGMARAAGVPYLGSLPWDAGWEDALGDAARIRESALYRSLQGLPVIGALLPGPPDG